MADTKKLAPGDVLFTEGDPASAMFIVKTGKLVVLKGKSYHEVVLGHIGPNEVVGEMGFFDKSARSATVKAKEETEVIELSYKALQAQLDGLPSWVQALMRSVNQHLRDANQKLKELQNQKGGGF